MKPKLILLNGNPGIGKSTLAQRYIDEHPMALNLDIDNIWILMGGWRFEPRAQVLKLKYAYAIAAMHLAERCNVIVPQLMCSTEQYDAFERIADTSDADMYQIALIAPRDEAIERFKTRARNNGFESGFRPGGIIDTGGREHMLATIHDDVLATIALRPNIKIIESIEHETDSTYTTLLNVIS
jgi:predicted kinase